MSLRAIHIVFIVATIALSVLTAVWGVVMFQSERGDIWHIAFAAGSAGVVVGMSVYAMKFIRKTRELGIH